MSKVLLVNPGCVDKETYGALEPFPVAYLAAFLRKHGHEVKITDEMAGEDFSKDLAAFRPDIVGVTSTTQLIRRAYEVCDQARRHGALTVLGGPHASALPEEASAHAEVVVVGDGEHALLDIAEGKVRSGVLRYPGVEDIDQFPFPARDLLRMDYYLRVREFFPNHVFKFAPPGSVTASVITSRGCPHRCIFCYNSRRGMPVRFRSVDSVLGELSSLKSDYGVTAVQFADDEMFSNKTRARELFSRMTREKLGFVWSGCARANHIDAELLALARDSGCRKISIGFESGSQRILEVLKKKTTLEQNRRAVTLCKEAGVQIGGFFMLGNPTETLEDIELTRKFIRESALDYVGLFLCTALPGTELYEKYADKSRVGPGFWERLNFYDYEISVNTVLSRRQIEGEYERLLTEIYGKRKVDLLDVLSRHLRHPVYTLKKLVNTPHKLTRLIKSVFDRS